MKFEFGDVDTGCSGDGLYCYHAQKLMLCGCSIASENQTLKRNMGVYIAEAQRAKRALQQSMHTAEQQQQAVQQTEQQVDDWRDQHGQQQQQNLTWQHQQEQQQQQQDSAHQQQQQDSAHQQQQRHDQQQQQQQPAAQVNTSWQPQQQQQQQQQYVQRQGQQQRDTSGHLDCKSCSGSPQAVPLGTSQQAPEHAAMLQRSVYCQQYRPAADNPSRAVLAEPSLQAQPSTQAPHPLEQEKLLQQNNGLMQPQLCSSVECSSAATSTAQPMLLGPCAQTECLHEDAEFAQDGVVQSYALPSNGAINSSDPRANSSPKYAHTVAFHKGMAERQQQGTAVLSTSNYLRHAPKAQLAEASGRLRSVQLFTEAEPMPAAQLCGSGHSFDRQQAEADIGFNAAGTVLQNKQQASPNAAKLAFARSVM